MKPYLKLFRWPNLLVLILTMTMVRYALIFPILNAFELSPAWGHFHFVLLMLATVLITAAGYAINDYFDLRADRINKPHKIILGKQLPRRTAILYHTLFNLLGVLLGVYLSVAVGHWPLAFIFLIIPFLLWMYSIRYKRRFFLGNFLVAVLSAFVVAIVWVFEYQALSSVITPDHAAAANITLLVRIYALFAFLCTFAREVIKDIEDIKGDAKIGCKTIPVYWGVRKAKVVVIVTVFLILAFVVYMQILLLGRGFELVFIWLLVGVQLPFIWFVHRTTRANDKSDYTWLSKFSKWIMLSGILSMLLFSFYFSEGFTLI